jgi:hypothetical protein
MRDRFDRVEVFFSFLEERIPADYIPFLVPGCIAMGVLLMLIAMIVGYF